MVSSAIVVIDEISPEHPYLQLAARLREQIQTGEIVSRLPSLTGLTGQTGLAVGTVRRAIEVLAQEDLVRTVPGSGTFVIAAQRQPACTGRGALSDRKGLDGLSAI
jgi:GntR family transcriptional regulator